MSTQRVVKLRMSWTQMIGRTIKRRFSFIPIKSATITRIPSAAQNPSKERKKTVFGWLNRIVGAHKYSVVFNYDVHDRSNCCLAECFASVRNEFTIKLPLFLLSLLFYSIIDEM